MAILDYPLKHLAVTEYSVTAPCFRCGCPIELKTTEIVGERVGVPCPCACGNSYTIRWDFSIVSFRITDDDKPA